MDLIYIMYGSIHNIICIPFGGLLLARQVSINTLCWLALILTSFSCVSNGSFSDVWLEVFIPVGSWLAISLDMSKWSVLFSSSCWFVESFD